jgi:hypothetical protein
LFHRAPSLVEGLGAHNCPVGYPVSRAGVTTDHFEVAASRPLVALLRREPGSKNPGVKELVHNHVLGDFAKAERPWVEALCDIIADNAGLLAKGDDASFQNKVHLAMQAKGFDAEPAK